ncbi:MAG: hypothetical protein A3C85_04375 [Candidatus Doudnabacteria bacterium RIFCSPHIGHO2_02_FULL_48_21]|uniref:Uncharacterized protein n=1 Tax=Candidatus Doudnabacteria bacterium RIFCSPLOWO2_02_FULL_48_13 TaxID=1817845 RepID=A0A1F5QCD0_9BACT|nr:MAG: hypothetical protein A3K05_00690 [Candidatus Doudnabacteria bacterium RIFCSPHIGHO2_01_48_18]OGE79652.1 MAG: hypothetical protein A2668_00960 [Candidatus Doudnabacteria bacterium RIFCSPHIGHO2_01_FULL_48_180]OGE91452.1 MAG: hypothetical protein A3F44_01160 [Candidatus Doudnabacteria bacterium RIFCSPHIGHO2_12_FULL_47_25]OGE93067.1 MAG: hypothetical protein A3C85_04375 [Candidatus Doudnabacteria bacterium RIFCSPHIGHO2_02_FULL_48_21]OGE98074.1 MAG: hypothetical protein A3A83_02340 [Candidatu
MTPDEQKTIDRLIGAVNLAYNSSGRLFWRGFLWGLGRGLGATVGLALILAMSIFFLRASGLDDTFGNAVKNLDELSKTINSARQ